MAPLSPWKPRPRDYTACLPDPGPPQAHAPFPKALFGCAQFGAWNARAPLASGNSFGLQGLSFQGDSRWLGGGPSARSPSISRSPLLLYRSLHRHAEGRCLGSLGLIFKLLIMNCSFYSLLYKKNIEEYNTLLCTYCPASIINNCQALFYFSNQKCIHLV